MKNFNSSRVALVLGGALLVGIPASVLLPGCGGGSSNNSPSVSTTLYSAPVQLSASQTGTLKVSVNGVKVEGSLIIPVETPVPQVRVASAIPTLPAGEYKLTGNFLPPRGFGLTGDFPAPVGTIIITGQLPTTTEAGSYTVNIGGGIVDGVIPIVSPTATPSPTVTGTPRVTSTPIATVIPTLTPVPTATPHATATPIPAGNGLKLTYSQAVGANDVPTSTTIPLSFGQANVSGGALTCIFEEPGTSPSPRHSLQFELRGQGTLIAGRSYPMSGTTGADYFELVAGGNNRKWESTSGTIKITSIVAGTGNTSNIQLTITDGHFKAAAGFPSTGTFVLNGTAKFSAGNGSGEG